MLVPDKVTNQPWREQALARIAEQRFVLDWLKTTDAAKRLPADALHTIELHWQAAATAATTRSRRKASVARVSSHLDAVDTSLLRIGTPSYVHGQLPGLVAQMRKFLPQNDVRRRRIEKLAQQPGCAALSDCDRDLIVAAHHAACAESRREVTRLRSFEKVLLGTAVVLSSFVLALTAFAAIWPAKVPICFSPDGNVVCTTSTNRIPGANTTPDGQPSAAPAAVVDKAMRRAASGWDLAIVELVGLMAAGLAAATSLRKVRGTSTPFSLPTALALLKLPTGALTAVLGLLLMRGEFIPGLSALDSSGQILAWAVLLGYSQQLLTRFVDQRAQTVLENFGRTTEEKERANSAVDATPAPVL
jgi:hypothetical protein